MRIRLHALPLAIGAVLALPVQAQDTPHPATEAATDDRATELDTVVVTSTKREERMQDVPAAIGVIGAKDIETAGLTSAADIAPLVPGFVMVPLFGSSGYNPVIRGLSTTIGEPNVGFFVDGVYMPSRAGLDFMLDDNIQRIEVARGPQYALYGRNTFAGAINVVTKAPAGELGGNVRAGVGSDGLREGGATLAGPLVGDRLFFRTGVQARNEDGFYENGKTGGALDWSRRRSAYLTLDAYPGERFDARLNVLYERLRDGDVAQRYVSNNGGFVARYNDLQQFFGDVPTLDGGYAVTPGRFDRDNLIGALSLHYDADAVKFTSITAYNRLKLDQLYDSDYTPVDIAEAGTRGTQKQWSQEFTLTSQGEHRVDWLAGVYVYDFEDDRTDLNRFVGSAAPLGGVLADVVEQTRSRALFGQATWHMTDRWSLGLAMRYTVETKSVDVVQTNLPSATNPTGSMLTTHLSQRFEPFTPGLYLTWKPTDRATWYASAVKAIKAGGFNTLITNGAIAPSERSYDAERSMNYEVGGKFSLLDGRLLFEADVYAIRWDDQIVRSIGQLGAVLNVNAGRTSSRGVETSFEYRPSAAWTLRGGASHNRSVYDDYVFPLIGAIGGDPDLSGKRLQYSPAWTANLGAMRTWSLAGDWSGYVRGDAQYRSDMAAVQTATATIPAATRVNVHVGVRKGRVELTAWVNNLFDEDSATSAVFLTNPATQFEFASHQRAGLQLFQPLVSAPEPRTFGLGLRYAF